MKIYSWNMLHSNKKLTEAFEFIKTSEFDIFCLQEVPEKFLKKLQTLPGFITFQTERELVFKRHKSQVFLVILSKYPISTKKSIPFPNYWPGVPLRTRLFMKLIMARSFKMQELQGMVSDILLPEKKVRVFNLHLSLGYPAWRAEEFARAMLSHERGNPTIVCGDFNVLEKPHITLLNWLLGGKLSDMFFFQRERKQVEEKFTAIGLSNPLRGKSTHPISRSQLDHILLSKKFFKVKDKKVLKNRVGSDHNPIVVEA